MQHNNPEIKVSSDDRAAFIAETTNEEMLFFINQLRCRFDIEEIANLFEHPDFSQERVHQALLMDAGDCFPLTTIAAIHTDDFPEGLQKFTRKCSNDILAKILFSPFKKRDCTEFEGILGLITSESEEVLKSKEKLESYLLDCIERIDSCDIDRFILQDCENQTNLTNLMRYNKSKVFIKLIQKASSQAIRIALLKDMQKVDSQLFSLFFPALSQENFNALIAKVDTDTAQQVLENLSPSTKDHYEIKESQENNIALFPTHYEHKGEKDLTQLLEEIKSTNKDNAEISQLLVNNGLKIQLELIHQTYKNFSNLHANEKTISEWNANDLKAWAKKVKQIPNKENDPDFLSEMMAVIMQAVKIHSGYNPRNTQLLSLLLFLNTKDQGRLEQIATGEGKSFIIAMLAIIKVLQGHKVDIVTSSPVLAIHDSESNKALFDLFDITVAHNENDDTQEPKACYKADIVYGTAASFQGDILRDEYYGQGTRNQRQFDIVICDEVDSLLIDDFSRHSMLLMPKSGMEHLQLLLAAVWQELARIEQETLDETIQTTLLKEYLTKLITDVDSPIYIPTHLKEFALYQADFWIKSAINVRHHFIENIDYIITQDKNGDDIVSPVDYINTGVVQHNMVWTDGTHQFLQMKHQLKMRPESLSPCFISNLGFFNRYGKNIFGLTGTFGTKVTQELLQYIYSIDLAFIPTFKEKQFIEIPGIISANEKGWLEEILKSVQTKINNKQAALIICKTIRDARHIEAAFQAELNPKASCIKCYTRNDNDEKNVVTETMDAGHIMIATNLAGRGTHIQTSNTVEEHSGLYVCLTFLPRNKQVEDQAFGRTSRNGNLGTGQLIINASSDSMETIEDFKIKRDNAEILRLQKIKQHDLAMIKLRDDLFSRFCLLMKQLRAIDNNENKLAEIEDRWVFWLKKWTDRLEEQETIESSIILSDYEQFKQSMETIYAQNAFSNPCHLICNANESDDQEKAIAEYTKAIDLDPSIISVQAYYNRAFSHLKNKNREDALNDLATTKLLLEEQVIPQLQAMPVILDLSPDQPLSQSAFNKHVQNKIDLYRNQIQHIDNIIQIIQNADPDNELVVESDFDQLYEIYKQLKIPTYDMIEMYQSGLRQFFSVKEIPPENDSLLGALGVVVLGVIQIVAGVVISLAGGAYIGQVLISEGINDILFAVQSVVNGHFSWREYQASKTTSVAISIITAGINVIKTNQAGITKKTIDPKEFIAAAKQQVTQVVVTAGIKEAINLGANHLSSEALKHFKSDIRNCIRKTFLNYFNQDDTHVAIDKLIFSDCCNHNLYYTNELKHIILSIIHSNHRIKSIAENILSGVIAHQSTGLAMLLQLADIGCALDDITHLTERICEDLSYSVKLLSGSLRFAAEDQSATRNILYDAIIDMITQGFMSALYGNVIRPLTNSAVSHTFDALSQKIQRVCYAAQFVKEKKTQEDPPHTMREKDIFNQDNEIKHAPPPRNHKKNQETTTNDFHFNSYEYPIDFQYRPSSFLMEFSEYNLKHYSWQNLYEKYIFQQPENDLPIFENRIYNLRPHLFSTIPHLSINEIQKIENDRLIYAITQDNQVLVSYRYIPESNNLNRRTFIYHAELGKGKPVLGAGELIIENGMRLKRYTLNDCSGHYRPHGRHLRKFVLDEFKEFGLSGNNVNFHYQCGTPYPEEPRSSYSFIFDSLQHIGNKFNQWHVPERALGFAQCVGGIAQVGVSVAGGVLTAETGIGPIIATGYATMGIDAAVAGCQAALTGQYQPTLLNQGLQEFGLNQTQATIAEMSINVGPLITRPLMKATTSALNKIGFFSSKVKTHVSLRNGNIFASHPTLFHAKTNLAATENIFKGIPTPLNPNNRFGAAFYTAQNGYTTINELAHHGATARYAIRYHLNESQAKILDLTQPAIAKKWGYAGDNNYAMSQAIAHKARVAGYNVIRFNSARGAGANLAILNDFNTLLMPQKIVTVPRKQPSRFSNPWHQ